MRKSSSHRWIREHISDPYVKMARELGFRSRAAFKLLEIDRRDRILYPRMTVIDLGAAPGGWSQLAAERVGSEGCVIAVDLLSMPPIAGVRFIRGDLREGSVVQRVRDALGDGKADLVLSDMAPNMSGVKAVDQARVLDLVQAAHAFAGQVLREGGDFLVKVFHGEGFEACTKDLAVSFRKVDVRKPGSSRGRSSEVYMLARFFGL